MERCGEQMMSNYVVSIDSEYMGIRHQHNNALTLRHGGKWREASVPWVAEDLVNCGLT